MSEDLTNISLSKHASSVADKIMETGVFDDALTAAKFGMAYAVKYYMNELDTLGKLDELGEFYDSSGKNYNVGSVDPDHYIADLMSLLYPGIATPYRYARILMCYGLNKLGDRLEDNKFLPISNNM